MNAGPEVVFCAVLLALVLGLALVAAAKARR